MAVRNLEGIIRAGRMEAEEKANARQVLMDSLFGRVEKISALRKKCLDAVETILALESNGLRCRFEAWQKGKDVQFINQYRNFELGRRSEGMVEYHPLKNTVEFDWCNHGMMEHYSTTDTRRDNLIHYVMESRDRAYDNNLTALAIKLEPWLDAFFAWVDTL